MSLLRSRIFWCKKCKKEWTEETEHSYKECPNCNRICPEKYSNYDHDNKRD